MSKRKGPPTDKPNKSANDNAWNIERGESMDRALSMGSLLFRVENYKPIMMALHDYRFSTDKAAAAQAFSIACDTAGLEVAEKNWLWNYLKHYTLDYASVTWASPGDGW